MIGIVLVSHSQTLAEGVRELAGQMAPDVTIGVAGGDDDGGIGTSYDKIVAALEEANTGDGAVILYDLGSAKLTAEMVIEMLDPQDAEAVQLVEAPLVEGTLAAATSITSDASLDSIAAAARAAGRSEAGASEAPVAPPPDSGQIERSATLRNPLGLHARPAGAVVRALADLDAQVRIVTDAGAADASSLLSLVGLGATGGDEVRVAGSGADAETAVDRILAMIQDGFGELDDPAPKAPRSDSGAPAPVPDDIGEASAVGDRVLAGQAAAPGGAVGPAVTLAEPEPSLDVDPPDDVEAERARLDGAIADARAALDAPSPAAGEGDESAGIFAAHRALLDDPALVDAARHAIDGGTNAQQAWWTSVTEQRRTLERVGTELVAARAADVLDVGHRVLRALGVAPAVFTPEAGEVVLATDVTPSQLMALHAAHVGAVVTAAGSPTAHAAIIARSLGVPLITGAGAALQRIADGTTLLVDADVGQVTVNPDEEDVQQFRRALAEAEERRQQLRASAHESVMRPDGTRIRVGANVASITDAQAAVRNGADEVGLLRTEFWFTDREDVPTEDEQTQVLTDMLAALGGRAAIVRTMDVGGDKRAPALHLDESRNGFLGQRGIRWCLTHPDIFRTHLRAILRAAGDHRVRLMFPFVTTLQEVRAAKEALRTAAASLAAEGVGHGQPEEVGVMLEIPGAALRAAELADEVDFFSIGTNDLIQYLTAADRTVAEVAHLATAEHAALLQVVDRIVDAARSAQIWVGVCGEIAANPTVAAQLTVAGITELSMTPTAIPAVKWHLRNETGEPVGSVDV